MSEQSVYDESEQLIGISSYISEHRGFSALVKARFSDFIVHEINANGEIARLMSLENNLKDDLQTLDNAGDNAHLIVEENARIPLLKRSNDSCNDPSEIKKIKSEDLLKVNIHQEHSNLSSTSTSASSFGFIKSKLSILVGEELSQAVVEFLTFWENENTATANNESIPREKYFTLPLIDNKEIRKEIHMLIKSDAMKPIALADTFDKKVRIWHRKFERDMPNFGKFDSQSDLAHEKKNVKNKSKWPKDRPDYLQFLLYKENIDTGTAVKEISQMLHLKAPQGNSNKNWKQHHKHLKGGTVGYAGMKDKRGVTTQFCTVYRKTPEDMLVLNQKRIQDRQQEGGGNSNSAGFALMRVGHFQYVKSDIRIGSLRGNRFDVVLRNICLDDIRATTTNKDRITDAVQVIRLASESLKQKGFINYFGMQRFGKFKDTHLVGIAALGHDFEKACDIIMRVKSQEHERSINARIVWQNRFVGINLEDERSSKDAEAKAAKIVAEELGRFMNCEQSIVNSLLRNPRDYKRAFGSITRPMRSMFFHAYQSYLWNKMASHRIDQLGSRDVCVGDLVLIECVNSESSGLKGKKVKEVTVDDMELCQFKITDVVLPLVGTKVIYPNNINGDYLDELLAEDGLSKDSFEQMDDDNLVLVGDYRKLICKPSDFDFQIKLYKDPLQPLVQTDLMKVHNVSLSCMDVTDESDASVALIENEKTLIGLKVGFTLPSSAYATILLRELTKRPTSADYQSELLLEGECDVEFRKIISEKKNQVTSKPTKVLMGASFSSCRPCLKK